MDGSILTGTEDAGSLSVAAEAIGEDIVRVVTLETADALVMISNRGGRCVYPKVRGRQRSGQEEAAATRCRQSCRGKTSR